ncbi:helix-turn-helix transcriptional regulator [Vibrio alginolyticus]|nr:AlpA family phage regulatory protein [Vibrio parahaemolyticus]MDF4428495.1 AlpA family phage regulatory protein [Vibrio parahaemolyticus]MDF4437687.1 AlpA family phage regulatory protein [Vibrio parahaemolyticus]MDF4446945.1 AlpA family phage regulatory protein [Vibrio parahaemolyticus]
MRTSREILTTKQICTMTNRSVSTITRWWKGGRFPKPLQHHGRTYGWDSEMVQAWFESHSDEK